ncbi:hypothetical protein [Devosia sp. 2618]|uniref:hypothetical protein n=1 Tax=Devosia sp. 2618 TaxID=3156454 RepID=UPI00339093CE
MSQKLDYDQERAKLAANYWNGLAIATMALGALPFVVGATGGDISDPINLDWLKLFVQACAAFFAAMLSRLFHILALRSISKVCAGF